MDQMGGIKVIRASTKTFMYQTHPKSESALTSKINRKSIQNTGSERKPEAAEIESPEAYEEPKSTRGAPILTVFL